MADTIAKMNGETVEITMLVHATKVAYGVETALGKLWKPSESELLKTVRFVFGAKKVIVVSRRLDDGCMRQPK